MGFAKANISPPMVKIVTNVIMKMLECPDAMVNAVSHQKGLIHFYVMVDVKKDI